MPWLTKRQISPTCIRDMTSIRIRSQQQTTVSTCLPKISPHVWLSSIIWRNASKNYKSWTTTSWSAKETQTASLAAKHKMASNQSSISKAKMDNCTSARAPPRKRLDPAWQMNWANNTCLRLHRRRYREFTQEAHQKMWSTEIKATAWSRTSWAKSRSTRNSGSEDRRAWATIKAKYAWANKNAALTILLVETSGLRAWDHLQLC